MRDIIKYVEELTLRLRREAEALMKERQTVGEALAKRRRSLGEKRDEELRRVDTQAAQQKALISDIFNNLLAEVDADILRNDESISKLSNDMLERPAKLEPASSSVRSSLSDSDPLTGIWDTPPSTSGTSDSPASSTTTSEGRNAFSARYSPRVRRSQTST